jgi:hypothetical protein
MYHSPAIEVAPVTIKPHQPEPKKPYAAPRVVAYGSVSLLTQSRRGSGSDGGEGTMTGLMEMV